MILPLKDPKSGHFFCEESDWWREANTAATFQAFTLVANQMHGMLGDFILNGNVSFVDFAFLKINKHSQCCAPEDPNFPNVFDGDVYDLDGVGVVKMGSASADTRGTVIAVNESIRLHHQMRQGFITVTNKDGSTPFSKGGDSGALVFKDDDSREAIGIIIASYFTHSYVLPLKTCFDAVREKLGFHLSMCPMWRICRIQPIRYTPIAND